MPSARTGRPPGVTRRTVKMIHLRRHRGWTYAHIAADLTGKGVPTSQGASEWTASVVRGIERSRLGRQVRSQMLTAGEIQS